MRLLCCLLITSFCSPVLGESPLLTELGLSAIRQLPDDDGMLVRGRSSTATSLSVVSLSALIHDPVTGSQTHVDIVEFNRSTSSMTGSQSASAGSESVAGTTGLFIEIGQFQASLGPSLMFAGGQAAGGGNFQLQYLSIPSFQ